MTKEDEEKFQKSKGCWFCGEEIKGVKVRDHCHFSGNFRGAAHQNCNLQARKPQFTPVFFIIFLDMIFIILSQQSQEKKEG